MTLTECSIDLVTLLHRTLVAACQFRMQFVRSLGPRCGSQEFTDEQVEQLWNLAIGVGAAADPAGMRAGNS